MIIQKMLKSRQRHEDAKNNRIAEYSKKDKCDSILTHAIYLVIH